MRALIVISDLLQMGHPGYRLMKNENGIRERQLPTFLDYVSLVYQRFKFYVNEESLGNLEYGSHLMDILSALKVLSESDDPAVVIPTREALKQSLPFFEEECKRMGKCFTSPPFVKGFYSDLSNKVVEAVHEMVGPQLEGME